MKYGNTLTRSVRPLTLIFNYIYSYWMVSEGYNIDAID